MALLEQAAAFSRPLLEQRIVRRVRRNHGLEHATIHMLSRHRYQLSGRSDESGFVLMGEVPTDKVESAVREALRRMQNGEHGLAIHPNCGTNLVTGGVLTTLIALLGFAGRGRRGAWDRFPVVMAFMMAAILFSQPLGMSLQRHFTTDGIPGDLQIVAVTRSQMVLPFKRQPVTLHRVVTRQS